MLGSVLSIKPILSVQDGEVTPTERVRTRGKAVERIYEIASSMGRAKDMFVACSGNDDEALAFMDRLRPHLPHTNLMLGYLGPVVGVYTDWTPLEGRGRLYPEDVDRDDPWQFKNFLVT
jgi:fatty acid-binding protein DegV